MDNDYQIMKHAEASNLHKFVNSMRQVIIAQSAFPDIREHGVAALLRLLPIAQINSGQSGRIAAFLLGIYNGSCVLVDLTDLRGVGRDIFEDCIALLRLDNQSQQHIYQYIENCSEIFERLAERWVFNHRVIQEVD